EIIKRVTQSPRHTVPPSPLIKLFPPRSVLQIPPDCLFNPLLKGHRRLPAEFPPYFRRVDGVPPVVAQAVFYKRYEGFAFAKLGEDEPDDVDIVFFVVPADVVDLPAGPFKKRGVDGSAVVLHIEP